MTSVRHTVGFLLLAVVAGAASPGGADLSPSGGGRSLPLPFRTFRRPSPEGLVAAEEGLPGRALRTLKPEPKDAVRAPRCGNPLRQLLLSAEVTWRFQSPGYPRRYPRNTLCGWVFQAADGLTIQLNCTVSLRRNDYLHIYDYSTEDLESIDDTIMATVSRSFDSFAVAVLLQSDRRREARGFRCEISTTATTGSTTKAPTVPSTTSPTFSSTQPPTVPTTQPPTVPTTQPPTVPTTQPPTVPTTQPPTVPTTQPPTVSTTQPPTVPTTQPPTVPTTQPPTSDCQCGVKQSSRIVGGQEASADEYPWMVSLGVGYQEQFCGGTLISDSWIVTAAHCISEDLPQNPGNLRVGLGYHSLSTPSASSIERTAREVIPHPDYNDRTLASDIALIRVDPVDWGQNPTVRPACLPDNPNNLYVGNPGVVTGWGALQSGGPYPDKLMEVTIPIISNAECEGYLGAPIPPVMVCAGVPQGGIDSCQGDSGGPMVVMQGPNAELVGAVSWGYGCAQPASPGVYARVTEFLPWIESTTAGSAYCPRV